jgi:subtilisin family serine protease
MKRASMFLLLLVAGLNAACAARAATTPPGERALARSWWLSRIDAPGAWTRTVGSRDVVVAVVDRGIDYHHLGLRDNIWRNTREVPNGIDDDGNGFVDDLHGARFCPPVSGDPDDDASGHGTAMAGAIGAKADDRIEVVGVAARVSLMAVKVVCPTGSAGDTARIARAIRYAVVQGAQIVQGAWDEGGAPSAEVLEAIREAGQRGILVVVAAGSRPLDNDGSPHYPASYDAGNLLAVAATDQDNALWFRSTFGRRTIHLAAPGVDIWSLIPGPLLVDTKTGPSMAAALVAGCAVLMKSLRPSLSPEETKAIFMHTVTPVAGLPVAAGGILNCGAAVKSLN